MDTGVQRSSDEGSISVPPGEILSYTENPIHWPVCSLPDLVVKLGAKITMIGHQKGGNRLPRVEQEWYQPWHQYLVPRWWLAGKASAGYGAIGYTVQGWALNLPSWPWLWKLHEVAVSILTFLMWCPSYVYKPSPPYMNQVFFCHKPTYLATIVKKNHHLCCWLIKSPVVLVYHGLPFLFAGQINMFASLFSVGSFTRKWWLVHSAMGSPPVELADVFSRLLQGMYRGIT